MVLTGFVWQGQRISLVLARAGDIKNQALEAVAHLTAGQKALAEGDFTQSNQAFSDAKVLLDESRSQLNEALSFSGKVLAAIDITGTVRSNQNLLDIADQLSVAGQSLATAAERFSEDGSLSEAIVLSEPELERAAAAIDVANTLLEKTSVDAVPEQARAPLRQLKVVIPNINELLQYSTAQIDVLLSLLGNDRDREYLVLLANNDELRPVGGFIGTVALVNVDRGEVESVDVSSVYDGDGQLKEFIAPPEPLSPIVDRWYLRDTNWFVDFPVDARKAAELFEKEGGPTVDGVILMTPQVMQNILAATGPIALPAYNQVVSAENFAEVTQQEVTYDYDKELNKPKQFLADLTPLLLERVFKSPENKLATLQALGTSLASKDLLLYFREEDAQQQVEKLGWAGAIPQEAPGILHVNNANIGGHKSDQFIEQEIDQRVQVLSTGDAEVVLTIRRTHNGPNEGAGKEYPEGENPAQKNNVVYQRVLVPSSAQLLEAKGFTPKSDIPTYVTANAGVPIEADADIAAWQAGQTLAADGTSIGHEAGYTFFGNWVVTEPGQTSVVLYRYRIPNFVRMPGLFDTVSSGAVSFVKQSGAKRTSLRVDITLPQQYTIIRHFPDEGITQEANNQMTYRLEAPGNSSLGFVFEKAS